MPKDNDRIPQKVMPRWHASWDSNAFESVAKKKAHVLSPPEAYAEICHLGFEKSIYAWYKFLTLSILAGGYVSLGASVCLLIAGNMKQAPWNPNIDEQNYGAFKFLFGAFGFPLGFMAIIICGGELFTSHCAYTTTAWLEGHIKWWEVCKMLVLSWIGNFMGCLITTGLLVASDIFDQKNMYLILLASEKISLPWYVVFVRGIFANWLVGIATWQANAALDLTGKAVGVWLPISAFAAIGFEHCIANMFILVLGAIEGAPISAGDILWRNIIPSTLGNYIGGSFFVGAYSFIYGQPRVFGKRSDAVTTHC